MPLTKLSFRPGINREITSYSNEGGWYDGDKIRFRFGFPEKIGGWTKLTSYSYLGACRSLHQWVSLENSRYIGLGTNLKFYTIKDASLFVDITPLRTTSASGSVTFAAVNGSSTITVTHVSHGAVTNDFVTIAGAVGLGGNITADVLNQEYQITVLSDDSYTFEAREAGTTIQSITVDGQLDPTPVLANASDTGNGGAGAYGAYQINTGLNVATFGTGWGVSFWGRGTWGSAAIAPAGVNNLRLWSSDNFGEDLIMNVRDGAIYYWEEAVGGRAVRLQDLPGSIAAPTVAKQVMISDRDRHVLAFGTDPESNPGVQDPLTIRFSSQETPLDWSATATNTAGELRLGSGSEIVTAVETRQQILVFTDSSLHAMQYLGDPFTFGVNLISENISVASPNAAVAIDDNVFWMGTNEFYVYQGSVQRIPCTVRDYVFDNFNEAQRAKSFAAANTSYSEVWWFYCSANSDNIDRYVVFNYQENSWYYGTMDRTAWIERGVYDRPIAARTDGYLYFHESGADDGSTNPVSAISSYVQSSPVDISDGEQFQFIRRMIPDVGFVDSTSATPTVDITTTAQKFTNATPLKSETFEIGTTTQQVNMRLRGREFTFRIASEDAGVKWRLGSLRYDIKPDGRR